jgi:argininosuccinate lyase
MAFAPEYVSAVLHDQFEDANALFLAPLMAIHHAHLVMLADRAIITRDAARALRDGLDSISLDDVRAARYDGSCEDLFFYVERLLNDRCGDEVAGRLNTARSRNDVDMTMYRMRLREFILGLLAASHELRRTLLTIAAAHRETLFAAHTHTQPAQPTTIAHYLMAVVEQFERDGTRMVAAYATTNRCPLGSCAITGTGFPIDRQLTADLLGFDGPTGNTYGSIATVDYLLESISAVSVLSTGHGRFLQDVLEWCMPEFGFVRLADGFVQSSSIMPQKRNPVAIEHARAIASKAIGEAAAVTTSVHNTPFGDIVDTEDDLQPLVFATFRDATRAVRLVAASLEHATFDVERMKASAQAGGATLTELADTLTRDKGLPFRTAHCIAARFAAIRHEAPADSPATALTRAASEICGTPLEYSNLDIEAILSPRRFVEVRRTYGGSSPDEVARAIAVSTRRLDEDGEWWTTTRNRLIEAEARLAKRSAGLQ